MPKETIARRHQKIQRDYLGRKAFTLWELLQQLRKSALTHLQVHRQCLLLKAPNKILLLDRAWQLELTLFHKDI